jgi:hypothetical protein
MLYSDITSETLPEVPGCPDITIERAIRDAVIEFCDSTLCYTVDQDPVSVYAGLSEVDLELPSGTRLVQFIRAQIGRDRLARKSRDDLFATGAAWQTMTGRPSAVTYASETSIRLVPIADTALTEQLYIRFAVAPTRSSTAVVDAIGERYFKEFTHGAKAMLLQMPGQPWSNPQLSVMYRMQFERGIREAKLTASQDAVSGSKRFRIPRSV